MSLMLYDDSLKYLNKSLVKLRNGYPLNIPLINALGNKFILGNGYLINSNVSRVDPQQVRRIEQILIKLIDKLSYLKKSRTNSSGFGSDSGSGFGSDSGSSSGFGSGSIPFDPITPGAPPTDAPSYGPSSYAPSSYAPSSYAPPTDAPSYGAPPLNPFDKGLQNTAAYIYTRDPNGIYYFGFVRKLYNGGRIRISNTNTGAAGTKPKYMGKWTNVGGGKSNSEKTHLEAVIDELNDETNTRITFNNVDVTNIYSNSTTIAKGPIILTANKIEMVNNTIIFIFEIKNNETFFKIFPKSGLTSPDILTSSKGEIDAVQSYNMEEIVNLQNKEKNYFIHYCIENFNKFVIPYICKISNSFKTNWNNYNINIYGDNNGRIPNELFHLPYREYRKNLYNL